MKLLLVLGFAALTASCTTLENRRDLYSPDVELYPARVKSSTTVQTSTTTTTTRRAVRTMPSEPEEAPALPGR